MIKTVVFVLTFFLKSKEVVVPTLQNLNYGKYLLINPLKTTIEVKIDCGFKWEPFNMTMMPRTQEYIFIKEDEQTEANCFLDSWHNK